MTTIGEWAGIGLGAAEGGMRGGVTLELVMGAERLPGRIGEKWKGEVGAGAGVCGRVEGG